jgi:predicted metal-dependent phosphoesterase TrpH
MEWLGCSEWCIMKNMFAPELQLSSDSTIDLHLHTTYSDGRWELEPLFDLLVRERFDLVAMADHDRPDTFTAIQRLASARHLPVLVAVEMSAAWRGEMTDLLCYGFDPGRSALNSLARDLWQRQQENTREVFANLQQQGYRFPPDAMQAILDKPSSQQPHALAELLVEQTHKTAGPVAGQALSKAGCTFVWNEPAAIVDAAHRDGALCLLAHPGRGDGFVTYDATLLDQFRQESPVDGLEAFYPKHSPAQTGLYQEYARRHDLLVNAGSDSHGPDKPPIKYRAGSCQQLLERLGIRVK